MSNVTIRKADRRLPTFTGREGWTLRHLIDAGSAGVAPRGPHYIFMLRKAGLTISTTNETHEGPFPGTHGRYHLLTPVTVVATEVAA